MTDNLHKANRPPAQSGEAEFRRLAERALEVLAADKTRSMDVAQKRLVAICDAFLASDISPSRDALARLRKQGVSSNDLIDHVIPATARMMGDRWFADSISFADVTIGTARLQETVRALTNRTFSNQAVRDDASAPSLLLVLPRGEDHSLGLVVAADQFRRIGYHVELVVDRHPRDIAMMVKKHAYCMIGISVPGRRSLASARDIVEKIRTTATRHTPIVIGGAQFAPKKDVLAATAADHVADDAAGALRVCGLSLAPGRERSAPFETQSTVAAGGRWKG